MDPSSTQRSRVASVPRSIAMPWPRDGGVAGIDNPLFYRDYTLMLLGDAKKMTEGKAL